LSYRHIKHLRLRSTWAFSKIELQAHMSYDNILFTYYPDMALEFLNIQLVDYSLKFGLVPDNEWLLENHGI